MIDEHIGVGEFVDHSAELVLKEVPVAGMINEYRVTGEVEIFPQQGGWYYVAVPRWISDDLSHLAERGLIPIKALVDSSTWDTSLLPKGDGSHFIALNAKIRTASRIDVGDRITVTFQTRARPNRNS